jgi:hypothetical protein
MVLAVFEPVTVGSPATKTPENKKHVAPASALNPTNRIA